jgi:bla regulator protein blaR1
MKKWMLWTIALAALPGSASFSQLSAQNITGTWQGAIQPPQGQGRELRIVIKISTTDADKLAAVMYSIDQQSPAIPATTFTRNGSTVKMTVTPLNGTYEGKVSSDGNSIEGIWSQGMPLTLNLVRATPETAWTIPDPPPPPKVMAADANPSFEVATIKPARPEGRFSLLVNRSGVLNTTSTTVSDLIKFAYDLHPRQITRGPSWLESEKYDITAKPDTDGIPNPAQLKMMVQKLLKERFQLAFHNEKKELSVYAITVAKGGPKLKKNETGGNLPGFGGGRGTFNVRNSTIAEFGSVLQANILEQPVVDQTGLGTTRWDFLLKWTPDPSQSQIGGPAPPNAPPPADNADAPPDIFTAFQQQLGLKIENTKAPVDVMVIDGLEKPSAN